MIAPPTLALGLGCALAASASADPADAAGTVDPAAGPVQVMAPTTAGANPAAVSACGDFAIVLDSTSLYYENFAEALETYDQPGYTDMIRSSNVLSRTALRQGAAEALSAANTPGLPPEIASPMRSWSLGATKLLLKMGLRGTGETLDTTVMEMNGDAYAVQEACAAAGTHA
ncbi:hypothetical protein [Mycolicibacterium xanthum]|uniref:hypothetical protein n=1 Tax=Mycolicibacterium xanthum TaxID=2796469 RepID=UPI002106EA6E|nr:hypothetical protein [Mycolicibacterium xanthum]